MANVKIPYALTPAVALPIRYANMESAIARGLPRLERVPIDDAKTLHIACYGPSLKETWGELHLASDKSESIISMSGSTKFLVERGIVPTYHVDMDPRQNKVMTSLPAVPGVTYLVASVCDPAYFDALLEANANVVLWHTVSSNWEQDLKWVAEHDPETILVSTGSTIGLGAIQLGGVLGFRRFEIHGMDGSFDASMSRHAGHHAGKTQKPNITWDAGGVKYWTSKIMSNAVAETINTAKNFPIFTVWHGNGLTQALIRESNLDNACNADDIVKRERLSRFRPVIAALPELAKDQTNFWHALLRYLEPDDLTDLIDYIPVAEARRSKAHYNTGTIPLESSVYLRAMTRFYQPEVIAEVGTFIGTSTHAMQAKRVIYTCDSRNDCLPLTESVITHPGQTSTQMLKEIQEPVDLFFFDGRIQPDDIQEITRLSHPKTVYVFDDYVGKEKGVVNVARLMPHVSEHFLMTPVNGTPSTLALIAPMV